MEGGITHLSWSSTSGGSSVAAVAASSSVSLIIGEVRVIRTLKLLQDLEGYPDTQTTTRFRGFIRTLKLLQD